MKKFRLSKKRLTAWTLLIFGVILVTTSVLKISFKFEDNKAITVVSTISLSLSLGTLFHYYKSIAERCTGIQKKVLLFFHYGGLIASVSLLLIIPIVIDNVELLSAFNNYCTYFALGASLFYIALPNLSA